MKGGNSTRTTEKVSGCIRARQARFACLGCEMAFRGRRKGHDLVYAGKVDHGFDKESAAVLRKRLTPLIRKTQPYRNKIAHRGIWVEPELAEIEYRANSAEGKVRHPTVLGLREGV